MATLDIPVLENCSPEHFRQIVQPHRRPVILRGSSLGPCCDLWKDVSYICAKEADRQVKVHLTKEELMDFRAKNFRYAVMGLHEMLGRAQLAKDHSPDGELVYLRAISDDPRGREKVLFAKDFPDLAKDFDPPKLFDDERLFSSVLRVSSPGVQVCYKIKMRY